MKNLKLNTHQTSILLKVLDAREIYIRNTVDMLHKEQNEINLLISLLHSKEASEAKPVDGSERKGEARTKETEQARVRLQKVERGVKHIVA